MKSNSAYTKCAYTKSAYTLIELLVVITISIIVFTVGYAGFREFSRRQALTGVSKKLISDLRSIQQLALTGQKPASCSSQKLIGYTFARVDQDTYTITANCTGNINTVTKTVDINGITFTMVPTTSVMFKVLGQGTNLSSTDTLTLIHTSTNSRATITIGIGGEIRQN